MATDKNGKTLPKGITMRSDGRYMGRFTYAGERYTLYDEDNPKRLKKAMEDMRYELEHGIYGDGDKMILNKWFKIWIDEYKENKVKATTLAGYKSRYELYAKKKLGKMKLKDIKTIHIQKMYNEMLEKGMTVGSVKNLNIVLSNMFRFALHSDYILKNPCVGIDWPKESKEEVRVLSPEEQQRFLKAANGNRFETLYIVAFSTGLRVGELTGLTWDDIDFVNENLNVNKTLVYIYDEQEKRYVFRYQTPKTKGSTRCIPLIPETVKALKKYKLLQNARKIDLGDKWKPLEGFNNLIFTTGFGTPMQETFVRKRIHCLINKINKDEDKEAKKQERTSRKFELFSPHAMRHTFATRAFESGMEPQVVQYIMGHNSLTMTSRYTHIMEEKRKSEIQKIQESIKIS